MSRPGAIPEIPGLPARYRLERLLSRGGMAEVYESTNKDRPSTPVALKLLRADGSRAEVARTMFRREVEALKGLRHDAIVQILDSFETETGLLGIELELVANGESLATLIDDVTSTREARPSVEWRVRMILRLLDGLHVAHKRGVVHRDLKPGNVLWDRDGAVLKLADFGIAAIFTVAARDPAAPTLRSFFTRPFASPEQLLQKTPTFPSDVYGFALLAASLLTLRAPAEDFEQGHLVAFLERGRSDLVSDGIPPAEIDHLSAVLVAALAVDANERPSLPELRDALTPIATRLRPRPVAMFTLSERARNGLTGVGFVAEGKIIDDINAGLRIRLERDDKGERVKAYGRSLFLVLSADREDFEGARALKAIDGGQDRGPAHERHRRAASPSDVVLRFGRGPGAALLDQARAADREATRKATAEIVDRATLIIQIERERLPVFAVQGEVLGGRRVAHAREDALGRASGYEGAQVERVEVSGGFRLRILAARAVASSDLKNVVRSRLGARGVDLESFGDDAPSDDWYSLLDDPRDVDVLDGHHQMVGKITGYDRDADVIDVQTDKKRTLLRVGNFVIKNRQKERQLNQQEAAIESLARGDTARADMPFLLSEGGIHRMGERPWVELLQRELVPEDRVRDLVDRILASRTVFCLQGPPGTGKTTIIAEVVAQILEREPRSRILVCAQANDAVANAIERILKVRKALGREWVVVRDVREERARDEGPWAGYDAAYGEFVQRVATRAGVPSPDAPEAAAAAVRAALDEWLKSVENGTHGVELDHRRLVQVWGITTARATGPLDDLDPPQYDLVIVDEAAKATVGEVLVPVVRGQRLLLVGDQKQLPPFLEETTQQALQEIGVSKIDATYSLFEHLFALLPPAHRDMLDVQFRMHPTIGDIVSKLFYEGRLKSGPGTENRPMPAGDFDRAHRVMWVDVLGKDFKVGKTSRANDTEIGVIERLLSKLDADAVRAEMKLTVAVIAAYRGQADRLRPKIEELRRSLKALDVDAATVDSFQGREADVVIYSLVRTGDAEMTFISDGRRFNVALSRAKRLLVIVGDRTGARSTRRLEELLDMIPAENQVAATTIVPVARLHAQLDTLLRRKPGGST